MQTKSIDVHNNEIHFNPKAFGQRYTVNGDKKNWCYYYHWCKVR